MQPRSLAREQRLSTQTETTNEAEGATPCNTRDKVVYQSTRRANVDINAPSCSTACSFPFHIPFHVLSIPSLSVQSINQSTTGRYHQGSFDIDILTRGPNRSSTTTSPIPQCVPLSSSLLLSPSWPLLRPPLTALYVSLLAQLSMYH